VTAARLLLANAAGALALSGGVARAQSAHPLAPEARVDVVVARITALHGGLGLALPVGEYLRLAVVGGAGPTLSGSARGTSARVDALARFVLDPDAASRWGVYVAGGASARYQEHADWRVFLALALGLEGRRHRLGAPFAEVGYGGGLRVGVGLRRGAPGRR
jgi:hypothetical protein